MVGGILESVTGPGGRDGYMHIEDAIEVLRMEEIEISEINNFVKERNIKTTYGNRRKNRICVVTGIDRERCSAGV